MPAPGTARPTAPSGAVGHAVLPAATWLDAEERHATRADAFTAGWRRRKPLGEKHAIEDFLFTYYPTRPAPLRRWHPGAGVVLAPPPGRPVTARTDDDPAATTDPYAARATWRWYRETPDGLALDAAAYLAERGDTVRYVAALLEATASRPGRFGCFGLHEWAMVYRDRAAGRDHRHPLPLRLGHEGTDDVVASHPVGCSHFDAFRFFTPEAVPLNRLAPTRESQPALEQPGGPHATMDLEDGLEPQSPLSRETQVFYEQPGCLHAAMDCYKWALKLGPLVPGDLLLDAFELAREIRYTDMQASPYDVTSYGLEAIAIETPAGKAEYVRRQRSYAARSNELRHRLITLCDAVLNDGRSVSVDAPAS